MGMSSRKNIWITSREDWSMGCGIHHISGWRDVSKKYEPTPEKTTQKKPKEDILKEVTKKRRSREWLHIFNSLWIINKIQTKIIIFPYMFAFHTKIILMWYFSFSLSFHFPILYHHTLYTYILSISQLKHINMHRFSSLYIIIYICLTTVQFSHVDSLCTTPSGPFGI